MAGLLLLFNRQASSQTELLDKVLTLGRQRTTIYDALNVISVKAECYFVYDSKVVNSEKRVKLEADHLPLKKVLDDLLENPELRYKVIGQHILIYKETEIAPAVIRPAPAPVPVSVSISEEKPELVIRGHVFDNSDKSAVPYVSIGIRAGNIGTITNADGYFVLKVPPEYSRTSLSVSHLGYISREVPLSLLIESEVDIYLERRVISMQEVIIRYLDPKTIIIKAIEQRKLNNSLEPVYMTSFYREGVQKNNRFLSFSEAVFSVYKTSFAHSQESDQVKLLKSRKIQNVNPNDTVYLKLKGGILSALQLDLVKNVPGFLNEEQFGSYTFTYSDLVSNSYQNAYAITFIQNPSVQEALYTGTLFIDRESFALLGAEFEINPAFLQQAADNLVLKKSRKLRVKLEKISYSVSYNFFNGRYYLNHVRCDLNLKTRLRNHISSDNFNTFLELATCKVDTLNVTRFPKEEVLKPNIIFSDIPYRYDDSFWGDYNVISPEEKLNAALLRIIPKIEEIK